eukprot:1267759-Rhodomonas_salina.1
MPRHRGMTALAAELVAREQRWVALMMGVHARLGAHSLVGCVPEHVWEQLCVDAMGVNLEVDVEDEHGNQIRRLRAYSTLKELEVIYVLRPVFHDAGLRMSRFTLATEGGKLKRHGTMGRECSMHDSAEPIKIRARPLGPEDIIYLSVRVRGQMDEFIRFKLERHRALAKLFDAYCAARELRSHPRFLFDGSRIHGHQTPECLDMDNDDVIDVVIAPSLY